MKKVDNVVGFLVELGGAYSNVSINYTTVDEDTGKYVATNQNNQFLATNKEIKEHIKAIEDFINTNILNKYENS